MSGGPAGDRAPQVGRGPGRGIRDSRVGREALVLLVLYLAHTLTRLLAPDDLGIAAGDAAHVLTLERFFGLEVETGRAATLCSYWYASLHHVVTLGVLIVLHRRTPAHYGRLRTTLVLATLLALIGYVLLPTAPPRLTAGYVDVLAATSDQGWWGAEASTPRGLGAATNELAAMPSMHVGWSLWVALALRRLVSRPWVRALAWGHPVITAFVVVATGDHWVLDAVAGAVIVLVTSRVLGARTRGFHPGPRAPVYDGRSTADHRAGTTNERDLPSTVVATGDPRPGPLHGEPPSRRNHAHRCRHDEVQELRAVLLPGPRRLPVRGR